MDNKDQDQASFDFNKENNQNDYKLLSHKLKSICESINLLEKNFLDKEK